jgi:hypothetical protein
MTEVNKQLYLKSGETLNESNDEILFKFWVWSVCIIYCYLFIFSFCDDDLSATQTI